jgi:hypothetical protein
MRFVTIRKEPFVKKTKKKIKKNAKKICLFRQML